MHAEQSRRRSRLTLRPLHLAASLALAFVASGLFGCVNQQEYDKLYTTNRALQERNVALQQELDAKENSVELLQRRVAEGDATVNEVQQRNASLNSELLRLRDNYRDLNTRLNDASLTVLDPAVDRELRRIAAAHPRLVTYDAQRGMVEFASDLTFASGSVEVRPEAQKTLEEFAVILRDTPAARNYDIRIVGHTDNVRPSKPATVRNHPTNMHLSVHRAIAVRDVLQNMGFPGQRMEAAGWGPYRPAVPNNPGRQGTPQNRRVEIFLVPSVAGAESPGMEINEQDAEPQAQVEDDFPMK